MHRFHHIRAAPLKSRLVSLPSTSSITLATAKKNARQLSNATSTPKNSSSGSNSTGSSSASATKTSYTPLILIAFGLLATPSFVLYKVHSDPSFRNTVQDTLPGVVSASDSILERLGIQKPTSVPVRLALAAEPVKSKMDISSANDEEAKSSISTATAVGNAEAPSEEKAQTSSNSVEQEQSTTVAAVVAVNAAENQPKEEENKKSNESHASPPISAAVAESVAEETAPAGVTVQEPVKAEKEKEKESPKPIEEKAKEEILPSRENLEKLRSVAGDILTDSSKRVEEQINKAEKKLNRDLEVVLAQDLSTLNENGLRERVVQLVLELKDRNKWEALRLHEIVKQVTNELVIKYEDLLRKQATTYESVVQEEIAKAHQEAHIKATVQADDYMKNVLAEKERAFVSTMQDKLEEQAKLLHKKFEAELRDLVTKIEQKYSDDQKKRADAMKELQNKLVNYDQVFKDQAKLITQGNQAQELAAAAIFFMEAVNKPGYPLERAANNLKKAARGDSVVIAALGNLSPSLLKEGTESLVSLASRFEKVKNECHRLSLVPEGGGIVSMAMSKVTASLLSDKPNVNDDNTVDGILFRAQQALSNNDLVSAVESMERLPKGLIAEAARDWVTHARDLMIANSVVKVSLNQALLKSTTAPTPNAKSS